MRRTILLTALSGILAISACTPATDAPTPTAAGTSMRVPASQAAASPGAVVTIEVRDFTLDPSAVSVTGSTVALAVTNEGPTVHNVAVRDASGAVLFGTRDLREGESETVSDEIAPGAYVLFCSLAGHESLGIVGTLSVASP